MLAEVDGGAGSPCGAGSDTDTGHTLAAAGFDFGRRKQQGLAAVGRAQGDRALSSLPAGVARRGQPPRRNRNCRDLRNPKLPCRDAFLRFPHGAKPSARFGVGLSHPCARSGSQQHRGRSRCVSPLRLLPFSRTSARGGTWRIRPAWATGARRGRVRSACPFTVELGRLSPLPTGGHGLREGRARTRTHGRGCGVCPQPGLKCPGVPGSVMRGKAGGCRAGAERACPGTLRGAKARAAASL